MNEMSTKKFGRLGDRTLFIGGDNGGEQAIMLHDKSEVTPMAEDVGGGIYMGGLDIVMMAVEE
eukprot:CAMPEP_0118653252 /NCGR_PEP_ID=MMETSP0785-20121206/11737_1 /TAXON_ID=91992 /ORGANISM="Bolidomonas pacifica, Strain CCMP 1866" /LENGTH=62 /DNA_ID=CAMNT_0006545793 /DNA_START=503 /DNA_END=688 /DNA_ORIENTATION=-